MFLLKKNTILGVLLSVTIVGGFFYLYNLKKPKSLHTDEELLIEDYVDDKGPELIEEESKNGDLTQMSEEREDEDINENSEESEESDKENNSQKNNNKEEIDEVE